MKISEDELIVLRSLCVHHWVYPAGKDFSSACSKLESNGLIIAIGSFTMITVSGRKYLSGSDLERAVIIAMEVRP